MVNSSLKLFSVSVYYLIVINSAILCLVCRRILCFFILESSVLSSSFLQIIVQCNNFIFFLL